MLLFEDGPVVLAGAAVVWVIWAGWALGGWFDGVPPPAVKPWLQPDKIAIMPIIPRPNNPITDFFIFLFSPLFIGNSLRYLPIAEDDDFFSTGGSLMVMGNHDDAPPLPVKLLEYIQKLLAVLLVHVARGFIC